MLKSAVGSALLVAATQSVALSLGGTQGGVIIGRPLDVLVQSTVEAAEAASGLCLEAEILYGDMRVSPTAVTVAIHRLGADGTGALRVRSSQPVNEPIVTLVLKAGCEQRYTRSYALLADYEASPPAAVRDPAPSRLSDTTPAGGGSGTVRAAAPDRAPAPANRAVVPAPAAPVPWTLAAPAPRPAGVTRLASKTRPGEGRALAKAPSGDGAAGTTAQSAPAPAPAPTPAKAAVSAPVTPEAKPEVAPAPATPRLKLDPVDVPPASLPGVGSPVLEGQASTDPTVPDPKVAAMEQELQGMRSEQERLRVAIETVNAQLAQAQSDRYSSSVVYVLLGLLVALLAALLVVMRRRREVAPTDTGPVPTWWSQATSEDSLQGTVPAQDSARAALTDFADLDAMKGLEVLEPGASTLVGAPVRTPPNLDALLDLMQQVEFFESIGQTGDAIATLQSFTQAFPGMSELPYLLWLHRGLESGDAAVVDAAQRQYQTDYGRLPPSFGVVTPGLDTDKVFAEQLCEVWPTLGARNLIEMSLWSQPGDPVAYWQVRTPTAARDLLLLLGMLDVMDQQGVAPPPSPDEPYPLRNEKGASGWLDLDLTDPVSVARVVGSDPLPVVPPVPAEPEATVPQALATERPPLDFEFLDFKPPGKADGNKP